VDSSRCFLGRVLAWEGHLIVTCMAAVISDPLEREPPGENGNIQGCASSSIAGRVALGSRQCTGDQINLFHVQSSSSNGGSAVTACMLL